MRDRTKRFETTDTPRRQTGTGQLAAAGLRLRRKDICKSAASAAQWKAFFLGAAWTFALLAWFVALAGCTAGASIIGSAAGLSLAGAVANWRKERTLGAELAAMDQEHCRSTSP